MSLINVMIYFYYIYKNYFLLFFHISTGIEISARITNKRVRYLNISVIGNNKTFLKLFPASSQL